MVTRAAAASARSSSVGEINFFWFFWFQIRVELKVIVVPYRDRIAAGNNTLEPEPLYCVKQCRKILLRPIYICDLTCKERNFIGKFSRHGSIMFIATKMLCS